MSNLQLGLIIAGILLVIGVVLFNRWQERRLRRRMAARASDDAATRDGRARIEPTLRAHDAAGDAVAGATRAAAPPGAVPAFRPPENVPDDAFSPPMDVIEHPELAATEARVPAASVAPPEPAPRRAPEVRSTSAQPDPDIESIATFRVPTATPAGEALSALLQGRFGKPVRWFGRTHEDAPWLLLAKDTPEAFTEFAGCLLLADRNGPASRSQLDTFLRAAREAAKTISPEFDAPDVDAEVKRAEMLDRLCADVDVQIGLTIMKSGTAAIAGTRLRGVAEASGFRLAPGGKFEYVHEETGHVEYSLTNLRNEPFTAESLRLTATHGVVFVLDIPRVADPARTFDRMKLAAKRMAKTLQAQVVDDNRRPLDDAALASIRAQVDAAAQALSRVHIEPGSARALALFGA